MITEAKHLSGIPVIRKMQSTTNSVQFTLPYAEINGAKLVLNERAPIILRLHAQMLNECRGKYTVGIGPDLTASMTIGASIDWEAHSEDSQWTDCQPAVIEIGHSESGETIDIRIVPHRNWLRSTQSNAVFEFSLLACLFGTDQHNLPPGVITDVQIGIARPQ